MARTIVEWSVVSYSKLEQEKPSWNELESNALQYRFNVLGELDAVRIPVAHSPQSRRGLAM